MGQPLNWKTNPIFSERGSQDLSTLSSSHYSGFLCSCPSSMPTTELNNQTLLCFCSTWLFSYIKTTILQTRYTSQFFTHSVFFPFCWSKAGSTTNTFDTASRQTHIILQTVHLLDSHIFPLIALSQVHQLTLLENDIRRGTKFLTILIQKEKCAQVTYPCPVSNSPKSTLCVIYTVDHTWTN